MRTEALRSKDFWTGVLYVSLGAAAMWIARDYAFGSASRMGAGYFPTVLGGILLAIGLVSLLRAFAGRSGPVEAFHFKPLLLVIGATVLFGLLVLKAGFAIALSALLLVSAMASENFRIEVRAVAGLILFVTACALVFVKGLGLPLPLVGSWFAS